LPTYFFTCQDVVQVQTLAVANNGTRRISAVTERVGLPDDWKSSKKNKASS